MQSSAAGENFGDFEHQKQTISMVFLSNLTPNPEIFPAFSEMAKTVVECGEWSTVASGFMKSQNPQFQAGGRV